MKIDTLEKLLEKIKNGKNKITNILDYDFVENSLIEFRQSIEERVKELKVELENHIDEIDRMDCRICAKIKREIQTLQRLLGKEK